MSLSPVPDQPPEVRVLRGHGEIDVVNAADALGDLPALAHGGLPLVLDLADVTFFDSSGLRLLDGLARECARIGTPLRVVAPPGTRVRRVLDVVGLSDALACDDLAAALEQVRSR